MKASTLSLLKAAAKAKEPGSGKFVSLFGKADEGDSSEQYSMCVPDEEKEKNEDEDESSSEAKECDTGGEKLAGAGLRRTVITAVKLAHLLDTQTFEKCLPVLLPEDMSLGELEKVASAVKLARYKFQPRVSAKRLLKRACHA